jgi:competence protein ComEC
VSADWRYAGEGVPEAARKSLFSRIRSGADDERQRFFLWSPIAVGLGIAAYFALPTEPTLWLALVPLIISLLILLMTTRGTLAATVAAAATLAATGFGHAKLRVELVRAPALEKPIHKARIEGEVLSVGPRLPRGARLALRVTNLSDLPEGKRPQIIRVRTMSAVPELRRGDRVRVEATLSPPAGPSLPGSFDFARTAWFEKIGGVGYTFKKIEATPRGPPATLIEAAIRTVDGIPQTATARIHAALPGDTGGVAAALITGERGGISQETNAAYRSSGLFHILSISGLHMVIMAGAVFYCVRLFLAGIPWLALRYPIKKWAALAGMLGALGYLSISGGAFATVRSALMILVVFGRRNLRSAGARSAQRCALGTPHPAGLPRKPF